MNIQQKRLILCIVVTTFCLIFYNYLLLKNQHSSNSAMRRYLINHKYLRRPTKYCTSEQSVSTIFVMVLVLSHFKSYYEREVYRETWGSATTYDGANIGWIFVLGNGHHKNVTDAQIEKESNKYGDILQFDFLDSYRNLTLKTVNAFKFVLNSCDDVQFVMKTDDDVTVNAEVLIRDLRKQYLQKILYLGKTNYKGFIHRDKKHKWYISKQSYPNDTLPPYNIGLGYVFSIEALHKTIASCPQSEDFPAEDAFIGICASHAGVSPVTSLRFTVHFYNYLRTYCGAKDSIVTHGGSITQRTRMWKLLNLHVPASERPVHKCSDDKIQENWIHRLIGRIKLF